MSGLPEVGERYGRYQISRLLGEDGAGVVYEATDTMLRRSVALTVVGPDRREVFGRESALRAGIRSRHVVTVLDHGTIDDTAYRTTDHFPEGDLATWLRTHGPMPRTEALAVTSQVAAALADVHAAGVVHAGLAPDTILLRSGAAGPAPHLGDFTAAVPGRDDDRSDQHAVGVLLWTCLTGSAPVAADPVPQLPASSAEDRAINGLLLRLLSSDPEDRFASMGELRAAVDRVATGRASLTASPSVTLPVAPVVAGQTVRTEPMLFRSAEALAAEADAAVVAPTDPAPVPAPPVPAVASALPPVAAAPAAPAAPARAAMASRRRVLASSGALRRRPWWIAAVVALVLILGGAAFGLTRGEGDADPQSAAVSPPPTAAANPTPSPTPTPTPTPSATTSAAVSPVPPKPAIGTLSRSHAACTGTAGNYQKWAYPLTGFTPGRILHPRLAIRSDHGNGETTGKPVTVGPKGRATGDFCVPVGTHGTITITVAGTTARRQIG